MTINAHDERIDDIRAHAISLQNPDPLIAHIRDARLVLLGESTHGTSEFYSTRAEISRRLIGTGDFSFIVVEGDWSAIHRLNRYVKNIDNAWSSARDVVRTFDRWPQWMWANEDVVALAEWLRAYNAGLPEFRRVGFYGMDVYGQWETLEQLTTYLNDHFTDASATFLPHLSCFGAYAHDEWSYARAVARGSASCAVGLEHVTQVLRAWYKEDPTDHHRLHIKQKALVVQNAERHFRKSALGGPDGWNARVYHMHETTGRLLEWYGDHSRGIVWAHNTHVGDSRYQSMGPQGKVNIGQLSREQYGRDAVAIVGFGTYLGRVNAGKAWGQPMEIMTIPPAVTGSIEDLLFRAQRGDAYLIFDDPVWQTPRWRQPLGNRAIGVTYAPATDALYNFVPTIFPERYDAFVFFVESKELTMVK